MDPRKPLTLSELNSVIRLVINDTMPDTAWVIAEISECRLNKNGHCYIELIEKTPGKNEIIAKIRAIIWSYNYKIIDSIFSSATGHSLMPGIKVMINASVEFHEVYGLSLVIREIDPSYTLGDIERQKQEVMQRLIDEGLFLKNKEKEIPLCPQNIAVVSSETAAGYGDFINQISGNRFGYTFYVKLFPAFMQGENAAASISKAIKKILKQQNSFDVVVIIRGGGSASELNCFNDYEIAKTIASCPLPVLTGIGHERDKTIADEVASSSHKTPTAVAEFLIGSLNGFESAILYHAKKIKQLSDAVIQNKKNECRQKMLMMKFASQNYLTSLINKTSKKRDLLRQAAGNYIGSHKNRLLLYQNSISHLNPVNVLKRGFSITKINNKAITDINAVSTGEMIETIVYNGRINSKIINVKK